ncbi:ABC transporter substrate-binding protein [Trinickia mobilis]|uniref:ABC transporter substrate-binding protein n=1 Tax=Trinickia mobilis TaxID=2816356 RepID=UPI001A8D4793|nr:ABC transporter substrate-binding protein [Trinickia mobilis]
MLFLNYFWALDNGYFQDAGINVTSIMAKNGPMASQAVASGDADVGIDSVARVFTLRAKDTDVVAFAVLNVGVEQRLVLSTELLKSLPPNPSFDEAVKAMRGKTIATSGPGTTQDLLLRHLLRSRGLNPDQYLHLVSVAVSPALYIENMRNHAIDGLMTGEPIISEVVKSGAGKVVFNALRDLPPADRLPYMVAFASGPVVATKKEALVAFNRAIDRANAALKAAGYEGSKSILKKYWPTFSEEGLRAGFEQMNWPLSASLDKATMQMTADWQVKNGIVDRRVSPVELDKSFVEIQ